MVVDDSLLFRETLTKGLAFDPSIEVVGTAADPFQARDKVLELQPDVMTLDVEMPRMNGIEFLKQLMLQHPLPVVVVSAVNGAVFDALRNGAVDFVSKPEAGTGIEGFLKELIIKIKIASTAKVGQEKRGFKTGSISDKSENITSNRVIAIGASTGGTEAIYRILQALPRQIPGIVIVQHMPPVFTRLYAERLNASCALEVREAENRDKVQPGRVLIAPGNFHMRLKKAGKEYYVECFNGEKVNGHCPSVDILFNSVALTAGKEALGIILTGMGQDGVEGLLAMRSQGARTLGQDEASSVVYGMPKVAYEIGAVERQASLEEIPHLICSLVFGR